VYEIKMKLVPEGQQRKPIQASLGEVVSMEKHGEATSVSIGFKKSDFGSTIKDNAILRRMDV